MQPAFIHLRLHTEFSLVDGIVKIKPLVKRLAELNMPAIAVTDHANLFSLVKFYKAALGKGIKPIAGADVLVFNPEEPATPYRLTLLANNHTGYISLTELISKAYLELQRVGKPDEERYITAAVELALATDLPVVATNDVRFIHQKDFAAHEVRV